LLVQFMIAGELGVRVDDGSQVDLRPGDAMVQTGTNHAWAPSPHGALMGAVVFGARRVGRSPPDSSHGLSSALRDRLEAPRPVAPPTTRHGVRAGIAREHSGEPRRIVAGLKPDGASCLARVETVEEVDRGLDGGTGVQEYRIWAHDGLPVELPLDGLSISLGGSVASPADTPAALRRSTAVPDVDGIRVTMVRLAPQVGPGSCAAQVRTSDSLTIEFVIAGEVTVSLAGGATCMAGPADVIVQNGTSHELRAGPGGALIGAVALGATRLGGPT
jgi:hypothetical protein